MSTFVEKAVLPKVLLAAHVNDPLSLNSVARITRSPSLIENLPEDVISLPSRNQEMVGSGIPEARHVISSRTPGNKVTRVPICTETGFKLVICSTEDDATSIFGNVASVK